MKKQPRSQATRWCALCACLLFLASAAGYGVSRTARADALPIPVEVPLPEAVLFTDNFGNSMAIDGDTLVVGAPWTDVEGAENQGVAYIYTRNGADPTGFTLLKSITGSNSGARDEFGWGVAIDGDTVVVGNAPSELGAAYIFERNQGGANNWGEVKTLVRDDGRTFTHFGRTLAIVGDTIVVGAPLGLGDVTIFARNQGGANQWGKVQRLDSGLPGDFTPKVASFGEVLVFDGNRLVVTASGVGLTAGDVPTGSPAIAQNFVGAVYVFEQENGQWGLDAKLFSSDIELTEDPLLDDSYGASLAINGDLLFVGATVGRTNGVFTGKVFVYQSGAGTAPPFGQPGAWGEIAQLTPSDGVAGDKFGSALYAVDDGLFVSAEKLGVGKVYLFRNPATPAASVPNPQAPHAWGELYGFSTSVNGSSTAFGNPITGSGNTVVIGDSAANGGAGAVLAFPKDALFAADPNATPSPTPTVTTTPPPVEPESCLLEQGIYLPLLAGSGGSPNAAVTPAALVTDTLAPGCVITGPGGVKLGAVAGAITRTIALTLETTAAPPEALPTGATPAGNYLRIASATNQHVDMETPFVLGVPVPASADSAHLVLVSLLPATSTLDVQASGKRWGYMTGVYDSPRGLFLARLPFLLAEGATFLLAEHPDFTSPSNQSPVGVQPAVGNVRGEFTVHCISSSFVRAGDCTATMEADAKTMLDEIYQRMTDPAVFGFPRELRLPDSGSNFIVSETISVTALTATYSAYLLGKTSPECAGAAGFYTIETGFLAICAAAGNPIDAGEKETLIHEFFHAVEYTYPKVWDDHDFWGFDEPWVIEGMAESAVRSYPVTKMQRSPYFGEDNLQKVDQALTTGEAGDTPIDEYLAQDFWVYVGARQSRKLSYLGTVLAVGGADQEGIDLSFKALFAKSLSEHYWGWVKNQTVENLLDVGVGPGVLCELSEESLISGAPENFPASEQFYPFNTKSAYDILPSLTAKVIEIDFGAKASALVTIEYQGCAGLQDPAAKATCVTAARQFLRSKIYVEGEPVCQNDILPGVVDEGTRHLLGLTPAKRYFVVVANSDPDNDHGYFVEIE